MKMNIKKQTIFLIWIPLVLSVIIIASGIFGVVRKDGVLSVDIFSFGCMCGAFAMIFAFTLLADIKRDDTQWNTKYLYIIQLIGFIVTLFAFIMVNIDLAFTVLLIYGIAYFITLLIFYIFKSKLIISELKRKKIKSLFGDLPYEFTSRKVYIFSKISGIVIIGTALIGIILMYANGFELLDVLPFGILCIVIYILSKVFIVQHEKNVEKRLTTDFYYKINGIQTLEYIDKILKEKLHKDKEYEIKLSKIEILEYIGEHEIAKKLYRSLGKPTENTLFTYEFLGIDFLDKTDIESYMMALKRIEKKITTVKKEKDRKRIMSLLNEYIIETCIRFNKKIDKSKLSYFTNAHYQLTRLRNNYVLGRYYYNMKDYEEALSRLEYVVKYGGEIQKYVKASQKIIDKIKLKDK